MPSLSGLAAAFRGHPPADRPRQRSMLDEDACARVSGRNIFLIFLWVGSSVRSIVSICYRLVIDSHPSRTRQEISRTMKPNDVFKGHKSDSNSLFPHPCFFLFQFTSNYVCLVPILLPILFDSPPPIRFYFLILQPPRVSEVEVRVPYPLFVMT